MGRGETVCLCSHMIISENSCGQDKLNWLVVVEGSQFWVNQLLTLCVNLTWLRDAQTAGNTFFLDVFVKVFLEEISIWISRQSKEDSSANMVGVIQLIEGLSWVKR